MVAPLSKNVTVPVSDPPTAVAPVTVAVRMADAPAFTWLLPVTAVVVVIGVTTNVVD